MAVLTKKDVNNYIPNYQKRMTIAWGNGFDNKIGNAFYLPNRKERTGESIGSIFSSIGNFVSNNQNTIKSIGEVASGIASAASNIASSGISIAKNVEELNNLRELNKVKREGISEAAKYSVLDAKENKPVSKQKAHGGTLHSIRILK